MVVNGKRGTARGSKIKDFEFSGKTGTAQVVRAQKAKQEELPVHLRDHGWFICFAPSKNPQIALAILVEHGMGGSKSAAPVAKYIFERLYKPQEYLVKKGIEAVRLKRIGYSELYPIDPRRTQEAWARNRRVEIVEWLPAE